MDIQDKFSRFSNKSFFILINKRVGKDILRNKGHTRVSNLYFSLTNVKINEPKRSQNNKVFFFIFDLL